MLFGLFGLVLAVPVQAELRSHSCVNRFTRLIQKLNQLRTLKVQDSNQVQALEDRPAVVILKGEPSRAIAEFSELGYLRDFEWAKKGEARWVRHPELVSDRESSPLSKEIQKQREAFLEHFGTSSGRLLANHRERFFSQIPEYDHLLTAKTLSNIPPGRYSFVVLQGENFLRLGMGHHRLGARMIASSAGEVVIEKDPITHASRLTQINSRSDTYRPLTGDLLPALDALWRQGIRPERLKVMDWDQKTLLLELN